MAQKVAISTSLEVAQEQFDDAKEFLVRTIEHVFPVGSAVRVHMGRVPFLAVVTGHAQSEIGLYYLGYVFMRNVKTGVARKAHYSFVERLS